MLTLKVPLKKAEKVKRTLMKKGLLDYDYKFSKDEQYIYYPIKKRFSTTETIINKQLTKKKKAGSLKDSLEKSLSKKELALLRRAYDVVGSIAIVEVPEELRKKEKLIAETLLQSNKIIKTVVKKADIHGGTFRTQKMKYLAGQRTKETIYIENNVKLKLDVEKVYFSARSSNERKRIYQLVKNNELILVMFSGCAPYPCVIAKNSQPEEVIGIELNPIAHKYAEENIKLNKISKVKLYKGDVNKVVPKLKMKFDRILMPLPKGAEDFLDAALFASKKGTIIHFYEFLREKEFKLARNKITKICKRNQLKCKILRTVKCGQFAPYVFRVCIDFRIE